MVDFTAPIPQKTIPESLAAETEPETGRLEGGVISAYDSFTSTLSAVGLSALQDLAVQKINPGRTISSKEYEEGDQKVPGLHFPNGVSANVLKLRVKENKRREFRENIVNNMPNDAMAKVSENVGSVLGAALAFEVDPLQIGVTKGISSLVSRAAPWVLSQAATKGGGVVLKGVLGAAEGTGIASPFALGQYEKNKRFGRDDGALSVLASSIKMGALAIPLRMGFGFDRPVISVEEDRKAQGVSADHLLNGKPAYIEPILKNAGYQMAKESAPFAEASMDMVKGIPSVIDEIDAKISEKTSTLKDHLKGQKELLKAHTEETGEEFMRKLDEVRNKPSDHLNDEEKELVDRFSKRDLALKEPTIQKKAFDISSKDEIKRTDEEGKFIEDFVGDKEKEVTQKEIDALQTKKDEFLERAKETDDKAEKTKLRFKASDFESRIKRNKLRLGNLEKIEKIRDTNPEAFHVRDQIKGLEAQKRVLKSTLENNKIYAKNIHTNQSPVTPSELAAHIDKINDWRSDFPYSRKQNELFRKDVDTIPENIQYDSEDLLTTAKDLRDSGSLTEEESNLLDEIEKDDEGFEKTSNAILDFVKCTVKRGEIK